MTTDYAALVARLRQEHSVLDDEAAAAIEELQAKLNDPSYLFFRDHSERAEAKAMELRAALRKLAIGKIVTDGRPYCRLCETHSLNLGIEKHKPHCLASAKENG